MSCTRWAEISLLPARTALFLRQVSIISSSYRSLAVPAKLSQEKQKSLAARATFPKLVWD
jgi:hypothetical protein